MVILKVEMMSYSVDNKPLKTVILSFAQWEDGQSGHTGIHVNFPWDQQDGLELTKADLAPTATDCQKYKHQRSILSSGYRSIPQCDLPEDLGSLPL